MGSHQTPQTDSSTSTSSSHGCTLFYHGGPGFNSNPERHLLKPRFEKFLGPFELWDEPSAQRGTLVNLGLSPAEEYLRSAIYFLQTHATPLKQATIIAHSFGAQIALHLAQICPLLIRKFIFISPVVDLNTLDRNICLIAAEDFKKEGHLEKSKNLLNQMTLLPELGNDRTELFKLILEDSQLLKHYWKNQEAMANYFSYLTNPPYTFDLQNLFDVRKTHESAILPRKILIDSIFIYGDHDPIVQLKQSEGFIETHFARKGIIRFTDSAHYPHLEEMDNFLTSLKLLETPSQELPTLSPEP